MDATAHPARPARPPRPRRRRGGRCPSHDILLRNRRRPSARAPDAASPGSRSRSSYWPSDSSPRRISFVISRAGRRKPARPPTTGASRTGAARGCRTSSERDRDPEAARPGTDRARRHQARELVIPLDPHVVGWWTVAPGPVTTAAPRYWPGTSTTAGSPAPWPRSEAASGDWLYVTGRHRGRLLELGFRVTGARTYRKTVAAVQEDLRPAQHRSTCRGHLRRPVRLEHRQLRGQRRRVRRADRVARRAPPTPALRDRDQLSMSPTG